MRIQPLSLMKKVRHRHQTHHIELALTTSCVVLLPPPFLTSHRRSRTQSNISLRCAPASPQVHRTPNRRTLGILNTPPPKATNSSQLKFKGSFTDPAHTRRRPSFGQVSESHYGSISLLTRCSIDANRAF